MISNLADMLQTDLKAHPNQQVNHPHNSEKQPARGATDKGIYETGIFRIT
jgi:hypothetical protein